jgi:hypothetical protein
MKTNNYCCFIRHSHIHKWELQNAKDKISNFEYIDLALMLRSNFNNQHNSEDTIGLNNGVLVIQKKGHNSQP